MFTSHYDLKSTYFSDKQRSWINVMAVECLDITQDTSIVSGAQPERADPQESLHDSNSHQEVLDSHLSPRRIRWVVSQAYFDTLTLLSVFGKLRLRENVKAERVITHS